jgi:formate dehydrogenase maturation protein FdhE
VNCTGCQHIDRRFGECLELVPYVLCEQCNRVFLINQVRCSRCDLGSTTVVSGLEQNDEDFIMSERCPLTDDELEQLTQHQAKAAKPILTQKEMF